MTERQLLLLGMVMIAGMILLVMLAVAFWRVQYIMKSLEEMLEAAERGTFSAQHFDETRLSRLEVKMGKYIVQNRLSKEHLQTERNEIEKIVSDISHQTKTPISNILLYTDLLQERELGTEEKKMVKQVEQQTERLRFITDSLVKVSRLENDIIQLHPEKQSILPLVRELTEEYERVALEQGIKIELEYEEPVPEAFFDYKWTREALINLLDNAVKYTALKFQQKTNENETGSIVVKLQAYELYHMIAVKDNGIGIPEEEQGAIFDRFYRGEDVHSEEGVGIGLYLAREILSKEGGYIRVRSKQGEGSEFALFLQALSTNSKTV